MKVGAFATNFTGIKRITSHYGQFYNHQIDINETDKFFQNTGCAKNGCEETENVNLASKAF